MSNDDFMKFLKYGCALTALTYFVYVFLPSHFIVAQHSKAGENLPDWFSRTTSLALFLLYGVIFYGLQKRRAIFWRLIPVLVATIFLGTTIGALSIPPPNVSIPWFLYFLIPILVLTLFLVFIAWWRHQKSYFSATPTRSD